MTYTEEMTTSEILLQLASMRSELLQAVNDIEKISKNICYKAEQTEPQTNKDFKVTYACSFTDCDNYKNFGFNKQCIECKRKQSEVKYKTEPQTDCYLCKWLGDKAVCGRCRNRNLFAKAEDEPQTEYDKYHEKIRPHDPHKDWF